MRIKKAFLMTIVISPLNFLYSSDFNLKTIFPPLIYHEFVQKHDPELDKWREKITNNSIDMKSILDLNKQVTCMGSVDNNSGNYRCLQFVIEMVTENLSIAQQITFPSATSEKFFFKNFFYSVPHAKNGDIAVYAHNNELTHFAFILNENEFLSKMGQYPYIIKHAPFALPARYKKHFFILRLLQKYKRDQILLRKDILIEIEMAKKRYRQNLDNIYAQIEKEGKRARGPALPVKIE